jgi:hypothetical protein
MNLDLSPVGITAAAAILPFRVTSLQSRVDFGPSSFCAFTIFISFASYAE